MPSKIPQFQFRDSKARKKLESLNVDPDKFAQAVLSHAANIAELGLCPICHKPFEECEYFQRLEED